MPSAGRARGACQPNDRAGVSQPWRILRTAGPPRSDSSTHYAVLGVPPDAGEGEIVRAYRRCAKRLHPDVNQDPRAVMRFQRAKAAYEMLRDPVRRFRYDATLAVIETPPVPVIVHHHTFISRRIEDGLIGGFVSLAGIGAVYALALLVVH